MMAALGNLSFYTNRSGGGIGAEEINTPDAQATLAALRQYDPSANFTPVYSGDGNLTGYKLDFNQSLVPGYDPSAISTTGTGFDGKSFDWADQLINPNAVTSTDLFGTQTQRTNIKEPAKDWLDYVGPLAVAAFGGFMGGIPGLTEGFGAQFQAPGYGGMDLSGLGASDPFLQGGTGAMDQMGSYGTGIPGSAGSNLGGAESSLYGADVLNNPASALGGGEKIGGLTQAEWDQIIAGQPENGSFVGPDGTDPNGFTPQDYTDLDAFNKGLDGSSLPDWLKKIPDLAHGLLSPPGASGGGGGGLLAMGQRPQLQYEDLTKILGRFYGGKYA
jgi:hypothetical protein